MSYHVWTISGYGISDERDDCTTTVEKVEDLLATTSNLKKQFHEFCGIDYSIDDIEEYEYEYSFGGMGIFGLLCDAINENEGIMFTACDDFEGIHYILYTPTYPWQMNIVEKHINEEVIESILNKYTTILFGHPFKVDYYSCENGG